MYRLSLPVAGARFGNRLPEHGLATGCRSTVWQPVAGTRFGNRMVPAGGNTDPEVRSDALDPLFLGVCLALCFISLTNSSTLAQVKKTETTRSRIRSRPLHF